MRALMMLGLLSLVGIVGCAGLQAVSINSRPPGAHVMINGEAKGYTPLEVELPSNGSYRVQLEKPGYHAFTQSLAKGMTLERYGIFQNLEPRLESVDVDLRPLP